MISDKTRREEICLMELIGEREREKKRGGGYEGDWLYVLGVGEGVGGDEE